MKQKILIPIFVLILTTGSVFSEERSFTPDPYLKSSFQYENFAEAYNNRNFPRIKTILKEYTESYAPWAMEKNHPLWWAIEDRDFEMIEFLLKNNIKQHIELMNYDEIGSLIPHVIKKGDYEMVEFLLNKGYKLNQTKLAGGNDGTDLGYALKAGQYEIARLLIDHGADPNKIFRSISIGEPGGSFSTHLTKAVNSNKIKTVEFLLSCGANVNAFNISHFSRYNLYLRTESVLDIAIRKGNSRMITLLRQHGAKTTNIILETTDIQTFLDWPHLRSKLFTPKEASEDIQIWEEPDDTGKKREILGEGQRFYVLNGLTEQMQKELTPMWYYIITEDGKLRGWIYYPITS